MTRLATSVSSPADAPRNETVGIQAHIKWEQSWMRANLANGHCLPLVDRQSLQKQASKLATDGDFMLQLVSVPAPDVSEVGCESAVICIERLDHTR